MRRAPVHTPYRNRIVGYGEEAPENLLASPQNWRIHPHSQETALSGALEEVGWVQNVIVNRRTGYVVDGHLRVAHAISTNEPVVPVVYVDLDEREEALILATFDPISAMAGTDQQMLNDLLAGLSTDQAGLSALLDSLATEQPKTLNPDDADLTPPADPITKPGDLWVLGDHRLLCGDSTKAEDVARLMDGELARLVVTSPPYNQNIDTFTPSGMQREHPAFVNRMAGAYADSKPEAEYQSTQLALLDGLWSFTTDDASVFYNHKHRYRDMQVLSPMVWVGQSRWVLRQEIVWDRTSSMTLNARMFMPSDERVYWLFKGERFYFEDGADVKAYSTVWRVPAKNEIQVSAPFANEIAERPIEACSELGDWVYDPYAGSGTVLASCERLGRRSLAMEIDPGYCDVIVRRWEHLTGQQAVRDG